MRLLPRDPKAFSQFVAALVRAAEQTLKEGAAGRRRKRTIQKPT